MSDARTYIKRLRTKNKSARFVLNALAEYIDENGMSQPSSKRLALDADVSVRSVSTALDLLAEEGIIIRTRTYTKGKRTPDVIELIGFVQWRDELDATFASKRELHVQKLHVQNLHLTKMPQDAVVVSDAAPKSIDANSARANPNEQKENSPTPPIRKTTPFVFGSNEPNTPPSKPKKSKDRKTPAYRGDFEELWKSWPPAIRQTSDKRMAATRWDAALKRWDADTLMLAAKHYLKSTKANDAEPGPWKPRTCQVQVFLNGKLEAAVEAATAPKSRGQKVWSKDANDWVEA